jgi:hypothetical protein
MFRVVWGLLSANRSSSFLSLTPPPNLMINVGDMQSSKPGTYRQAMVAQLLWLLVTLRKGWWGNSGRALAAMCKTTCSGN